MWQKVRRHRSLKIVMLITHNLITPEKNVIISPPRTIITVTSQHNHYISNPVQERERQDPNPNREREERRQDPNRTKAYSVTDVRKIITSRKLRAGELCARALINSKRKEREHTYQ